MAAAADPKAAAATSDPDRQASSRAGDERPPTLIEGIDFLGPFEESGLEDPPYIVRRPDGQLVQLPRLLNLVAEKLDGSKTYDDIARGVSQEFEKEVGPGDVKILVEEKLAPLGLLAGAQEQGAELRKDDALLALKLKTAVLPGWIVRAATTIFYPFFFPPVIVGVLVGFIALDVWLFSTHGVAQSFRHLLHLPATLLLVFGLMILGTFFHEMGHATGCRYGGARPGAVGVGIYIIWPAFYTDVNDAYRLGRWGRIRTDLGGVYFNTIFALCVAGVYFLTGFEVLLLVIIGQHFQMLQQFMPFVRLDGYYVVSDLTGVPDLFARIGPILRGMIPGREPEPKVTELKRWVRAAVTVWVVTTIPAIFLLYVLIVWHIPRLIATGLESLGRHSADFSSAIAEGGWSAAGAAVIQMGMLVLPTVGAAYVLVRTVKRLGTVGWRSTAGRPALRAALTTGIAASAVIAAVALWPTAEYEPIRPDERGTLFDATTALARRRAPGAPPTPTLSPPPTSASPSATRRPEPTGDPDSDTSGGIDRSPTPEPSGSPLTEPSPSPSPSPSPAPTG